MFRVWSLISKHYDVFKFLLFFFLSIRTSGESFYLRTNQEMLPYPEINFLFLLSCLPLAAHNLPPLFPFLLTHAAHVRPPDHLSAFHRSVPGYIAQRSLYFVPHILCLYTAGFVGSSSEGMLSLCHLLWRSVYCLYRSHENLCQWCSRTEHCFDSDVLGTWSEDWARSCTGRENCSCCGCQESPL